jgi:hypothetical protein
MSPAPRRRPEVEPLQDRALAGTLFGGVLDAPTPAFRHPARHHLALSGQVSGI